MYKLGVEGVFFDVIIFEIRRNYGKLDRDYVLFVCGIGFWILIRSMFK